MTEYYGELSLPLLADGARYWELNLAARNSDYSTFGSEATYKINTLDPLFCDLAPRLENGVLDVIDNRLQNIGGIEAKGFDVMLTVNSPEWQLSRFDATLNATFLRA